MGAKDEKGSLFMISILAGASVGALLYGACLLTAYLILPSSEPSLPAWARDGGNGWAVDKCARD